MATAVFVHDGNTIDYTPATDVAAGDVIVQGDLVGIAKVPIPAGALGALAVVGVFDLPKATGDDTGIAAGAKVYWKPAAGQNPAVATTAANDGGNPPTAYPYVGKAVKAAGDTDATVRVRLEQ
jgi:predicted RecA/RadA family phage recombinase